MLLSEYLTSEIYHIFLIFCRTGTALMVMPVFNAGYLSPRIRLIIALAISLSISQFVTEVPPIDSQPIIMLYHIFSEIVIGFFIGSLARIIGASIHVAGMVMTMQSGLAQAVLFDPSQSAQGALFGNFMELLAVVLIFVFNIHHLMIYAIVESYMLFPIGGEVPFGDFAFSAAKTVSKSFAIGVQLAAPLIVSGMLINLSSGLLARLMPSFQVYFVIMPAQIMISFFIFLATITTSMMWYLGYLQDALENFLK